MSSSSAAPRWARFRRRATEATIFAELAGGALKPDQAADLALGVRLRAYAFDRYKTKRKEGEERAGQAAGHHRGRQRGGRAARRGRAREAVADGVVMARDLVNEPANVLYPGGIRAPRARR